MARKVIVIECTSGIARSAYSFHGWQVIFIIHCIGSNDNRYFDSLKDMVGRLASR